MPLPYYYRLPKSRQALYRHSVALRLPELQSVAEVRALAGQVESRLRKGNASATSRALGALVNAICDGYGVPRVKIRVRDQRPGDEYEELQGLYEREEGEIAIVTVWMRTGTTAKVVKYRTFLRTALHEVVHHLDYEHFELDDSLHTEGFFQRESTLLKSVAPPGTKPTLKPRPKREAQGVETALPEAEPEPEPELQLSLF